MDKLAGSAVSILGISVETFYEMTPFEYFYALQETDRKITFEHRTRYEVARFQLKHLLNISGKSLKRKVTKVTDIELFPWDEEYKAAQEQMSPGQMKRALNRALGKIKRIVPKKE